MCLHKISAQVVLATKKITPQGYFPSFFHIYMLTQTTLSNAAFDYKLAKGS